MSGSLLLAGGLAACSVCLRYPARVCSCPEYHVLSIYNACVNRVPSTGAVPSAVDLGGATARAALRRMKQSTRCSFVLLSTPFSLRASCRGEQGLLVFYSSFPAGLPQAALHAPSGRAQASDSKVSASTEAPLLPALQTLTLRSLVWTPDQTSLLQAPCHVSGRLQQEPQAAGRHSPGPARRPQLVTAVAYPRHACCITGSLSGAPVFSQDQERGHRADDR